MRRLYSLSRWLWTLGLRHLERGDTAAAIAHNFNIFNNDILLFYIWCGILNSAQIRNLPCCVWNLDAFREWLFFETHWLGSGWRKIIELVPWLWAVYLVLRQLWCRGTRSLARPDKGPPAKHVLACLSSIQCLNAPKIWISHRRFHWVSASLLLLNNFLILFQEVYGGFLFFVRRI